MDDNWHALWFYHQLNEEQKALVGLAVVCFLLGMMLVGLYLWFTDRRKS